MNFAAIVDDFAHNDHAPVASIEAALAEPEAFLAEALPFIEHVARGDATDDEETAAQIIVHVLGEIGDQRAFQPLMQLLRLPGEHLDGILSDTITEAMPQILIAVTPADAGAQLEQAIIENAAEDGFVQNVFLNVWLRLVLTGVISREHARTWLEELPNQVTAESGDYFWISWVETIGLLGFADMSPAVEQCLKDKAPPTTFFGEEPIPEYTFEDFQSVLLESEGDLETLLEEHRLEPYTGVIADISGWHGYSEAHRQAEKAGMNPDIDPDWTPASFTPQTNPNRDVGRNDPCPCGSGKKYKKCCLAADEGA